MHLKDSFFENCEEEYCLYLDSLKEDEYHMTYEAFEWLKIREIEDDRAELEMCDL